LLFVVALLLRALFVVLLLALRGLVVGLAGMVLGCNVDGVFLAEDTAVLLTLLGSDLETGGFVTGLVVVLLSDEIGLLADTGGCLPLEFAAFCGEVGATLGC